MAFKQARTFTFTEMNVFSDFCQCDRVHVILFYVREDFADPFIFCEIRCGRKRLMWEMFYEQPPHDLHPDRYVQFVEIRLFFIKGDDFQHFFAESVGIAMAMTFNPELLLADEPTSALDVTTQAQIVRQMMELRDDFGTGIIIVTHNIGVAAYMADQLIVMHHGKVVDHGTREEVLNNPTSDYTKKLLDAVPEMEGKRYV